MQNKTQTFIKLENKSRDNYPKMILVHHSGGTDKNPLADTSHHTAQIMESWHLAKGWEGLGYHYVIHKDGAVWLGRPEHYHAAHTSGHNTDSIGICLAGNFDATLPTKEQTDSLRTLLKDILNRHPSIKDVFPHRKFSNKTCYGKRLNDTWASDLIKEDGEMVSVPKRLLRELSTFL